MLIELQGLTKTFIKDGATIEVLKGIDLTIAPGDSLAILGVSGAGKSTLITIIGTLDHPTAGSILYDGVNVFSWPEPKLAKFRNRRIGFVFQFHNLLPEFTALENVMLPALIGGVPKRQAATRASDILKELALSPRLYHRPCELSGGEQQRVALGRALVRAPEIILADEPTGNLDRVTGKKIEDLLLGLNQSRHITLVVVTHNRELAERMSRCIGLQDGKMQPE